MRELKVAVAAGLPTSLRNVASLVAAANGWPLVQSPAKWKDYDVIVYVSDPREDTILASRVIPKGHGIFYVVSEGPPRYEPIKHLNVHYVVTPSRFSKMMYEKAGVHVDEVVPHGIVLPEGQPPPMWGRSLFFYRAYYIPRKYPSYGLKALEEYVKRHGSDGIDIYLVGPPFDSDLLLATKYPFMKVKNPILPDEMDRLYKTHAFYLNLSDSEGFGLTPLEAMARGEIVVTAWYPAIRDYLPEECNVVVPVKGYWWEALTYEYILHAEYDPEDYLKAMEAALEMYRSGDKRLEEWSRCNAEVASKYDYRVIYKRFAQIAEEIRR